MISLNLFHVFQLFPHVHFENQTVSSHILNLISRKYHFANLKHDQGVDTLTPLCIVLYNYVRRILYFKWLNSSFFPMIVVGSCIFTRDIQQQAARTSRYDYFDVRYSKREP